MANITRIDPFDDLFRGFFVRPMDFNGAPAQTPSIKMDVQEQGDSYLVHAELPGVKIATTAALGLEPDFVEATGFAWLARARLENLPGNLPSVTGAHGPRVLGGIYAPAV